MYAFIDFRGKTKLCRAHRREHKNEHNLFFFFLFKTNHSLKPPYSPDRKFRRANFARESATTFAVLGIEANITVRKNEARCEISCRIPKISERFEFELIAVMSCWESDATCKLLKPSSKACRSADRIARLSAISGEAMFAEAVEP